MITPELHKAYAHEILQQLGGHKFICMTGAQYITYDSQATTPNLSFKIRDSRTVTHVTIKLDATDTYTIEFMKARGPKIKTVATKTGIYDTMLRDTFEEVTGLHTSLGTMGA